MAPTFDTNAVWLATGCSSGLGKSFATYIYTAGHNIVATARNIDSLQYLPDNPKVLKLDLDVASPDSIKAAIEATVKRFDRLDVVINNAGYNVTTEFEGFPEDEARKQMETMFWGPVNVTRESIRIFREVNPPGHGGTIVQVSSIGGYLAYQGSAFYHASKFALEGFTKSVARDMNPNWNINFLILPLGGVKTNFASSIKYLPRHPAYANDPEAPLNAFIKYLEDPTFVTCSAESHSLGSDSLAMMRSEVKQHIKEMEDWEEDTLKVMPSTGGLGRRVDQL